MMNEPTYVPSGPDVLVVTAHARNRHSAVLGCCLKVPEQPTEIELVEAMRRLGIDIEDFKHVATTGNDYPYNWYWRKIR